MSQNTQTHYSPIWVGSDHSPPKSSNARKLGVRIEVLGRQLDFYMQYLPGPATLADLADALYWLCDKTVDIVTADVRSKGGTIPCRKACCATCCSHMVPVSVAEAASLGRYLLNDSQPHSDYIQRFSETARRLNHLFENYKAQTSLEGLQFHELKWKLNKWYERTGLTCPMLHEDSCSIYSYRPMICRLWGIVGDEAQCTTGALSKKSALPIPLHFSDILREVAVRLDLFRDEIILLPCALDWYVANKQRCETKVEAEKLVCTFLDVLGTRVRDQHRS